MNCYLKSFNYVRAVEHGMDTNITSRLILLRSNPYTHSEFQFSKRYKNWSVSATMQDNVKCVRFKDIDYRKHPERWDTVMIPLTDEQEDAIFDMAVLMAGNVKYDLFGLLSFSTKYEIIKPNEDKRWCSWVVAELIKSQIGWLPVVPHQTHPTRLHHVCEQVITPYKVEVI